MSSKLESFLKSGLECILPLLTVEAFVELPGDLKLRIPNRKIFIHLYTPPSYFIFVMILLWKSKLYLFKLSILMQLA